jgi:hypothetical protein
LNRNLLLLTLCQVVPLLATPVALGWLARVRLQAQNPPTA